jgi:hypothetical protein
MRRGFALEEQASETSFAERIGEPRLRRLYDYWRSRRNGRRCPSRADIDPVEIPALLQHLVLTDVIDGGARFRWRLSGTEVERHFGGSMRGRYIDELLRGEYLEYLKGLYRTVLAGETPVYSENGYASDDGWDACSEVLRTARLMLPLAPAGEPINMVLVGQLFFTSMARTQTTVMVVQDGFGAD